MIKLFRNIRQKLLNEGKTTKYLKYAIGEIVLVVLGILIALQVNNWNENRKAQKEQSVFLTNIVQDLKEDLTQINKIIEHQSNKLEKVNALTIELSKTNDKDFKTIETLFSQLQATENDTFFANMGTYSTSSSEEVIGNLNPESLKIAITNLYERFYYRLTYNGNLYDADDQKVAFESGKFYNKITKKLKDKDVIENSEFSNLISIISYDNTFYLELCHKTKEEIERVTPLINQRLKN